MQSKKWESNKGSYVGQQQEDKDIEFFKKHVLELNRQRELYDDFCDHALAFAEKLKNGKVNTTMIRKIYTRILNAKKAEDIKLLRPHFAYTSGRNEKNRTLKSFMDLLDYLAKKMELDNKEHVDNFKQFMEAIVAYRKYVGGDEN